MSNINQYPLTATQINDEDYYDVDYWNGATYETRKISGATLKSVIGALGSNIYNADGTMTGDRILTGDNFRLLFQTMGEFIVHSHKNGVDNVVFEVRSDATWHGFIVKDHNTGVHMLACRNGLVEISDSYFLPGADGTPGQVMVTDGAGNVSWQTLVDSDTNIYNTDGTLTGNRILNLGSFGMAFITQVGGSALITFLDDATNPVIGIGGGTIPNNYIIHEVKGISSTLGLVLKDTQGWWARLDQGTFNLTLDWQSVLSADRNQQFQDADGVIALLSDIVNIYNSNGSLTGSRFLSLNGHQLYFTETEGQTEFEGNKIVVVANAGFETIFEFRAGSGQKRTLKWTDQGTDRWDLTTDQLEIGGDIGTDIVLYAYDDAGTLIGEALRFERSTRQLTLSGAFKFPNTDGTTGQVLQTDGAGNLTWQTLAGSTEKKIDTFYAYDMSAAAAGGGTYTWNGTSVGSTAITTLNERYRLQIASGVGQADGCFVNSILPSYYIANNNIRIDVAHTCNGTGGDYKIFVGLVKPNGPNFGDGTTTLWQSAVITASAGFPTNSNTFTFAGVGLSPNDPIAILVYRDPGDAQDTFTGDIYFNTINVEQV